MVGAGPIDIEPDAAAAGADQPGVEKAPIIIIGGGFGGLYTALALAERGRHPPILLIEPQDRFLFLPLLYELLSGELRSWEIAPRYDALLAGKGVAWLQDRVVAIDTERRQVRTAGGRLLSFARLVIATGCSSNTFGIPGADRHPIGFRSLADVERLQQKIGELLRARRPLQRLAVVGAGPTGIELACKLADLLAGSTVVEVIEQGDRPLSQSRSFNREQALIALQKRDIRLRTHTRVVAVTDSTVELEQRSHGESPEHRESLAVDGVLWTAGVSIRLPAIHPSPSTDQRGRLICRADLSLAAEPHVFAIGDVAHPVTETTDRATDSAAHSAAHSTADAPLPATAQVAVQQAPVLAANLLRSLAGEPLQPFAWKDLGEMISLGVGQASITGSGLTLVGPTAFQIRRIAYLSRLPGLPHQLKVAAAWLADWKP